LGTDKGLNPTITGSDTIAEGENTSAWIGLQALYEWSNENKVRLGGRFMTDLNVADRSVYFLQAFFQVGFDFFHSHDSGPVKTYEQMNDDDLDRVETRRPVEPLVMTPEATPWPSMTPEPEPEVLTTPAPPIPEPTLAPTPVPAPEPIIKKAKIIFTLDVNDLPFGFDNANLPKANAARVNQIGEFLSNHNKNWKSLIVRGYTDERGTKEYNMKLSKRRADEVRRLLIDGGADAAKIKARGFGKTHPRDPRHNEAAWAKNRRVELEFNGVKDFVLMKKGMTH
jgi:outer membrane protein OmpA-like peptidoglycan-associated protein